MGKHLETVLRTTKWQNSMTGEWETYTTPEEIWVEDDTPTAEDKVKNELAVGREVRQKDLFVAYVGNKEKECKYGYNHFDALTLADCLANVEKYNKELGTFSLVRISHYIKGSQKRDEPTEVWYYSINDKSCIKHIVGKHEILIDEYGSEEEVQYLYKHCLIRKEV